MEKYFLLKFYRIIFATLFFLISTLNCLSAQEKNIFLDILDNLDSEEQKIEEETINNIVSKVLDGDAQSEFEAGEAFHIQYKKIKKDRYFQEAIKWLTKSAEKNYLPAFHLLGRIYYDKDDYNKSFEYYSIAAKQGYGKSIHNLGLIYENFHKDYDTAFQLFNQAAELGIEQAYYNLGRFYEDGIFVEKNDRLAFEWYKKAAEKGLIRAYSVIGIYYYYGNDAVEANLEKALEWFMKGHEAGDYISSYMMATMYEHGIHIEQDHNKAFSCLRKAVHSDPAPAVYFQFGIYHHLGIGCKVNDREAYRYMKKAIDKGYEFESDEKRELYIKLKYDYIKNYSLYDEIEEFWFDYEN